VVEETSDDAELGHDEADITMIYYLIDVANSGKSEIRVLTDDTGIFVLLVYWALRRNCSARCRWTRTME